MFTVGQHVAIAPHTDTWMSGDRYGTVTGIGKKSLTGFILVKLDKSGRTKFFSDQSISSVD